jgi:hypothetical protein
VYELGLGFLQSQIRLNQLGYYPESEKIAIVESPSVISYKVVDVDSGEVVYYGMSTGDADSGSFGVYDVGDFNK